MSSWPSMLVIGLEAVIARQLSCLELESIVIPFFSAAAHTVVMKKFWKSLGFRKLGKESQHSEIVGYSDLADSVAKFFFICEAFSFSLTHSFIFKKKFE